MSTLSTINPTLIDFSKRLDPNGKIDTIVELMNQTNPIIDDMTFIEANGITSHRTTARSGIPTPTWRKLYGGVQPAKSRTVQITDSMGMMEAYAEVDKALADLNGNTAEFRTSEDRAFIEGMNQEFARTLFYGNESTTPEAFTGLSPRFNSKSAENASNILTSASTPDGSDNTSIWLIVWGPDSVHGIVPKGSISGLQMTDKGVVTVENVDGSNGRAEMYRTHYRWDMGLCVRDWRYIVRIQVDQEDLTKNAASGPDLIDLLAQAVELPPSLSMGRPVFYSNRTVRSYLRRQIANRVASSTLTMDSVAGNPVLAFDGIPFKRCDQLLNTETGIS